MAQTGRKPYETTDLVPLGPEITACGRPKAFPGPKGLPLSIW